MERLVCFLIMASAALGLRAQVADFPAAQVEEAGKCRLVKISGSITLNTRQSPEKGKRNGTAVTFSLYYGAKSSGYSPDDGIHLSGGDPDTWENEKLTDFDNTPTACEKVEKRVGGQPAIRYQYFTSVFESLVFGLAEQKWGGSYLSHCIALVISKYDEVESFLIEKCDFYDISSGQERLVLAGYCPLMDDYKDGNLMKVFFDRMYEYYR